MSKDTSGSAFPRNDCQCNGRAGFGGSRQEGISARDYFAAKAMLALISGAMMAEGSPFRTGDEVAISKYAFIVADAMIKARGE